MKKKTNGVRLVKALKNVKYEYKEEGEPVSVRHAGVRFEKGISFSFKKSKQ